MGLIISVNNSNIRNILTFAKEGKKIRMEVFFFGKQTLPLHPVVTIGMFDGVHLGHQLIINKLKEEAGSRNIVPVVITFRNHPRMVLKDDANKLKLLNTLEERYQLLESYGVQNCIEIPFNKEIASYSATDFVRKYLIDELKISGLILGYDNYFGNKKINDFDQVFTLAEDNHFFIEKVDALYCDGVAVSSTQIRNAIDEGRIELANRMLGYPYFFSGKVVDGNKVGRKIGFPTANISDIDPLKMIPSNGVYIVNVELNGLEYRGMMNIGFRPTFEGKKQSIEVHIFNFEGNLYEYILKIKVIHKLREEKQFHSVEELKEQLEKDKKKSLLFQ